jgi:hypothetical protein
MNTDEEGMGRGGAEKRRDWPRMNADEEGVGDAWDV